MTWPASHTRRSAVADPVDEVPLPDHAVNATVKTREMNKVGVGVLTGAHLLHDMSLGFLGMLLPMLRAELGFSLTQAGLLQPAQQIGSFFQPVLGSWADRVGAKRFVVAFLVVTSIFMSLLGTAPAFWVLLVLVFAGGLSSASYHPAGSASLSIRATPLLAIPGIVWAGIVLLGTRSAPTRKTEKPAGAGGMRWIWGHRRTFAPLTVLMLGRAIGSGGFTLFLPTLLTERGYELAMVAAITSGYFLVGGIGGLTTGWLSDKVGRKKVMRAVLILGPVGVGGFLLLGGNAGLILLLLAAAALLGEQPVLMALVQEWSSERRGTVVGMVLGGQFVLSGLGSLLIGWMGDMVSLETAFRVVAVAPLIGLPFVGRLRTGPIE